MNIVVINTDASRAVSMDAIVSAGCDGEDVKIVRTDGSNLKKTIRDTLKDASLSRLTIGGGDGSVALAASLLEQSERVNEVGLAILPLGTSNQYAKSLGISHTDMPAAIKCAMKSESRESRYIGYANDSGFLLAATIGISAKVFRGVTKRDKKRLGSFAYAQGLLRVIRKKLPSFTIRVNEIEYSFAQAELIVLNHAPSAGPITVASTTDGSQPDLEIIVYGSTSGSKLSTIASAFIHVLTVGRVKRGVHIIQANSFIVDSKVKQDVSVDGDVRETTPVTIRMSTSRVPFIGNLSEKT